jgi:hypothetical protein
VLLWWGRLGVWSSVKCGVEGSWRRAVVRSHGHWLASSRLCAGVVLVRPPAGSPHPAYHVSPFAASLRTAGGRSLETLEAEAEARATAEAQLIRQRTLMEGLRNDLALAREERACAESLAASRGSQLEEQKAQVGAWSRVPGGERGLVVRR